VANQEFTVDQATTFDTSSTGRWLRSHLLRYPWLPIGVVAGMVTTNVLFTVSPLLIGQAFDLIRRAAGCRATGGLAIALAIGLVRGLVQLVSAYALELLAQRLERDTREELFISLLGKSQTFHNRQQVGDIMARATGDVKYVNLMLNPGIGLILPSLFILIAAFTAIALRWPVLLAAPLVFLVGFGYTLKRYVAALGPISGRLRGQYGQLTAGTGDSGD
jgi:ATP-binding cassette subfamily B protein